MNRNTCRPFWRALCAAALVTTGLSAQALELRVEVLNAKSGNGKVNIALYNSAQTWQRDALKAQRETAGDKVVFVFANLEPGAYALAAFHDENGNDKLDVNLVGMPIERYGFSRDAVGNMGPAAFADAVVDVQADTTLTINLR